ncbi:MAG: PD40 domain-containing protein [Acidimicrobiia bacterium]|nr:PD40 domain-containing protein [Acidimicrobiia bacterium]
MVRRLLTSLVLAGLVACSQSAKLPPLLVQAEGLLAVDQDGGQVELLSGEAGPVASQPSWAPDSTFAVWTEFDATENVARIAMGNGESQRRVDGSTIPFFYGFSPDGKTLAYLGNDPAGGGVALGLLDVASSTPRLVDVGQPFYFDWSADSTQLLVHANQSDTYLLDLDGGSQPLDIAPGVYQAPLFLDDGRVLVVENRSLVAVDHGSEDREVIADIGGFSLFTAAGDRVAFTSNDAYAAGPLAVSTVGDDNQTLITDQPVIAFEWSPNGELLYYLSLSPDGLIPAIWDGNDSVEFEVTLPSTVYLQSYLPFWDQYSRFHTLWKADSSGFFLPRAGDEIALYSVGGEEATVVAEGAMALSAPG